MRCTTACLPQAMQEKSESITWRMPAGYKPKTAKPWRRDAKKPK
jgi:hypothetical protein